MSYFDKALKWWDGSAWRPLDADWNTDPEVVVQNATAIATSISLSVSATTINNGQSVTLTATVTGASSGTVQFRSGSTTGTIVGSDTTSPWSITVSPTSTTTYYACYVANGNYLASNSSGKTVTVKQKSVKKAVHDTRNSWQWGMSSPPHKVTSTFQVNTGTNNIPYSSAVITGCRIQVAGRKGRAESLTITRAGIYNNSDGAVATVSNPTLTRATSDDSPLSPTFNVPDYTVTTGTYRIGFEFPNTVSVQHDEHTGASGYTTYQDGGGIASQSLLWEIDYYVWV